MLKVFKIIEIISKNLGIIVAVARGVEKIKDELEAFQKSGKIDKKQDEPKQEN